MNNDFIITMKFYVQNDTQNDYSWILETFAKYLRVNLSISELVNELYAIHPSEELNQAKIISIKSNIDQFYNLTESIEIKICKANSFCLEVLNTVIKEKFNSLLNFSYYMESFENEIFVKNDIDYGPCAVMTIYFETKPEKFHKNCSFSAYQYNTKYFNSLSEIIPYIKETYMNTETTNINEAITTLSETLSIAPENFCKFDIFELEV